MKSLKEKGLVTCPLICVTSSTEKKVHAAENWANASILKSSNGEHMTSIALKVAKLLHLKIPLADMPQTMSSVRSESWSSPPRRHSSSGRGTRNIVLVDDSIVCLKIVSKFLNESGFDVYDTENAEAALELLRRNSCKYDLLIMDILMPSMSGISAAKLLKGDTRIDLPIILMSSSPEFSSEAVRMGAHAFLRKPIDKTELLACIEKVAPPRDAKLTRRVMKRKRPAIQVAPQNQTTYFAAPKVIIVDDSWIVLKLHGKTLCDLGYDCYLFSSGEEAFDHLCAGKVKYDLLITDFEMPGIDGIQLLQLCRDYLTLKIPLVVLSSNSSPTLMQDAFQLGADYCLTKPMARNDMTALFSTLGSRGSHGARCTSDGAPRVQSTTDHSRNQNHDEDIFAHDDVRSAVSIPRAI